MACFSKWDIGACGCAASGVVCATCTPAGIPTTLSITDYLGTYTATWNAGLSLWVTPNLCSAPVTTTAKCVGTNPTCNFGTRTAGALYTYSIECTSANHMTLNRYWYELTCVSPSWQYSPCNNCGGAVPGGSQKYSSSGSVAVTCGSISWSGTLTKISGSLADPVVVANSVSFSQ